MKFETKYNFGDLVYCISSYQKRIEKDCPSCEGNGRVKLADGMSVCPKCYGNKIKLEYEKKKWNPSIVSAVGKINISYYAPEYLYSNKNEITYMLISTGIGSGTCYYEENLFLTPEEAQKECDKRNTVESETP